MRINQIRLITNIGEKRQVGDLIDMGFIQLLKKLLQLNFVPDARMKYMDQLSESMEFWFVKGA